MSVVLLRWCAFMAVGLGVGAVSAAELRVSAETGTLHAQTAGGAVLWQMDTPDPPGRVAWNGDVGLTASGMSFDRFGRLAVRGHADGAARWPDAPRLDGAWDVPVEVIPPPGALTSDAHVPPIFDSAGNAWVFNTHLVAGDYSLQLRRSNGHDGTWGPLEIVSDTTNYVAAPDCTIDANDVVSVAFRDIAGGYHLRVRRHTPGSGWGPLENAFSTSSYWQAIELGTDDRGNLVVILDTRGSGGEDRVMSLYRDPATGDWSTPVQVSGAGYDTVLPTLLHNAAGDTMLVVYLVRADVVGGLYGHRWDSATETWGPAELLPGSEIAGFQFASGSVRYPGVVDAAGNATLLWENAEEPYAPHASRYENGAWQPAEQLLPWSDDSVDVENFAGIAANATGDVMAVVTQTEYTGVFKNRLYAFLYDAGQGWQPAENPYTSGLNQSTRVRVAFRSGRQAVATVLGDQGSGLELTSILYDGTQWAPTVLDIPTYFFAWYADLASDAGEPLLVCEAELGGGVNDGIKGTFLRGPPGCAGDSNCDGAVNWRDIDYFVAAQNDNVSAWAALFAPAVPTCPFANNDANGDGAANWRDIDPFVALQNTACR